MASIYTRVELVEKIKSIDIELAKSVSMSSLDTGQSDQEFRISNDALRRQRDYYMTLLNNVDLASSGAGIVTLVNKL